MSEAAPVPEHPRRMTYEEYAVWQLNEPQKHELHGGQVVMMAGSGDPRHGRVGSNFLLAAGRRLPDRCQIWTPDMAVRVPARQHGLFPDGFITCGEVEYETTPGGIVAVKNPLVVLEVPSDSSEIHDRETKPTFYQQTPSLRHLLIASRQRPVVIVISRDEPGDDRWGIEFVRGLDAAVELPAVGITLPLTELYRDVSLDADEADDAEATHQEATP